MYLAFKSLKISSELSQQWPKSERQSTNDVYAGYNRRSDVGMASFEEKMHKLRWA